MSRAPAAHGEITGARLTRGLVKAIAALRGLTLGNRQVAYAESTGAELKSSWATGWKPIDERDATDLVEDDHPCVFRLSTGACPKDYSELVGIGGRLQYDWPDDVLRAFEAWPTSLQQQFRSGSCLPRGWDHPTFWLRDGKPASLAIEPYELDMRTARELTEVCNALGLRWVARADWSFWNPGATFLVQITRKE